jgi:hypothetical protein
VAAVAPSPVNLNEVKRLNDEVRIACNLQNKKWLH